MAPAASARAVMSPHGSSACWPTSTASATTSAPHSSWIHFTATDVSRPPEYARTTRCGMGLLPSWSETGETCELRGDGFSAGRRRTDQDDRVVARHRPEHLREAGPVQGG